MRRLIGDTIGIIYTDVMQPFIEQYPDLDPDRGGPQLSGDRPAAAAEPIDDAAFAKVSRDAAVDALRALDALSRFVESREGARARQPFDTDADRTRQAIQRLSEACG